ncbi:MAG: hypothetical protein ABIQ95_14115 [Bdellovibrionia bacterium]
MAKRHRTSTKKTTKVPARARRKSQKKNGRFERMVSTLLRRTLPGRSYLRDKIGMGRSILKATTWISEQSTTILRPRSEVYREWRAFEQRHPHSIAQGPAGNQVAWAKEIVDERKNNFIHWRTVRPSRMKMEGKVFFSDAPRDQGTEVRVVLDYWMPAGRLGKAFAFMFGRDPDQQSRENLRNFKRLMETGEIPTAETRHSQPGEAA